MRCVRLNASYLLSAFVLFVEESSPLLQPVVVEHEALADFLHHYECSFVCSLVISPSRASISSIEGMVPSTFSG